jgi:hypothetical protein
MAPRLGDAIVVRCYSNRRAREGVRRRVYTSEEIDAFAADCPQEERCYYIPFGLLAARTQILLRLAPLRNNQRLGIPGLRISSSPLNCDRNKGP